MEVAHVFTSRANSAPVTAVPYTTAALVAALAMLVCTPAAIHRLRPAATTATRAVMGITAVAYATSARMASPQGRLASRSTSTQPLVASVVHVHRMHELIVSRLGGLYGP